MIHRQIILATSIFLAVYPVWWSTIPAAGQTMPTPYYPPPMIPGRQPVAVQGGPYLPQPPIVQVAPQPTTVTPPQPTVAPLPVNPPGFAVAPGGAVSPQFGLPAGPEILPPPTGIPTAPLPPNPIAVPVTDEEFAWDQIVDVVSDYFTVAREQRARRDGPVWTEGRIETAPQDGATWLEPHRRDSVGSFNRWESTFQTIRRRAVLRVIPDPAGYLVEVIVEKELEDLPSPEHATAGAATFRNELSLPSRRLEQVGRTFSSPCWIPLGRDPALEQRMLADISARLGQIGPGSAPLVAQ